MYIYAKLLFPRVDDIVSTVMILSCILLGAGYIVIPS